MRPPIDAGTPGAVEAFNAVSIYTRAINYMGLPAVSVPCGFDSNGLPIGIQIQVLPFGKGRILRMADAYQSDADWHKRNLLRADRRDVLSRDQRAGRLIETMSVSLTVLSLAVRRARP